MAVDAGSVFVRLSGLFDRKGFDEFDRNVVKAQKIKDINVRAGAEVDERGFDHYNRKLDEVRAKTKLRDAYKVTLGADYDSRAFNAYYRDLVKAKAAAASAGKDNNLLSRSFDKLAASAGGAGGAIGGGSGLGGRFGFLSGALVPLLGTLAALAPALLAVAGAATALAGSLAAAAAGAAAVGVGIGAALGPLAAVAGAVALRVAAMTTAFKALGTEQVKGGEQAKASAETQRAAAERVQQAQENLTKARFQARREVEDLTAAVIRSTLAEQDAALALRSAQQSAAETLADPRSTKLQRDQAEQDVKDARQRVKDAASEHQRALVDEKRGTDTLRQAQRQLADARHAATVASQKEGSAATDAQQKLGQLSSTERRLVIDFKAFVDELTKIFKPATDAIFGAVDRGLKLITPLIGGYKGRFAAIGQAIADVIDSAGKSLTGPGWTGALDSFVSTAQKIVKPIGDSVGSVLLILRNIAVATQPYVVELANNIRDALGGLADKTKDPSKVRDVIKGLVDQTKSWLGFMGAVAKLIFTIFSGGARQGQGLLDQITAIVKKWTAFLETDEGQRKMREFFKDSIKLTKEIAGLLSDVVGAFYNVGHYLTEHIGLIKTAIKAWAAYKTAAIVALGVSKGAAVASFIRGPAAGAAAGGAASAAGRGAAGVGAVGAGSLAGPLGTAAAIAALAAFQYHFNNVDKASKHASAVIKLVIDRVKELAEAGKPGPIADYARSIQDWGKKAGLSADQINALKGTLGELQKVAERNVGGVGKALDQAAKHFEDFRKTGSNNLHGLHTATADNMHFIKRTLGDDSEAGRKALVGNFKLAEDAVRDAMTDGKITTRDGLREIRHLMKEELAVYGITGQKATDYLRTSGHGSGNESNRGGGFAGGGWIGQPGMVGTDTVPAMLAPGEAVLNRHQQAVIEGMLGGGFLDNLFANVQTPHYFAAGGRVQPAVASLGNRLTQMFGLQVTSTTGGTHAPGSYHYQGLAEDLGGSDQAMARASAYLMSSGAYKSLLEGIHKPGLSVKDGKTVPSSFWGGVWDQHANHIHIALRALGAITGGVGAAASKIKAPTVLGGGALGQLVGGGLQRAASGARDRVASILGSMGGGDTAPAGVGGGRTSAGGKYNKAALEKLWIAAGGPPGVANVAAAIALAESGGNPGVINSIGATGLWQIYNGHGPVPGATNPQVNARMAVAKYRAAHGFSPWTTYTGADTPNHEKTYLRYLAKGGRIRNFASGGFAGRSWGGITRSKPSASSVSTLPSGKVSINQLRGAQRIRVKAYDNLTTQIADQERHYGQVERRYNQSDEVLIDPVTGAVNTAAIEKRAGELDRLMTIRRRILDYLDEQLTIARRVVKTYTTIINRLTRSLSHAKGKDRTGVQADIAAYSTERDTWRTNAKNVGFDITDAKLDIGDLRAEGSELRGTVAQPTDASTSSASDDGGGGDTGSGSDTGSSDTTDTPTAPTAADIAAAALADIASFNQGRADLLKNYAGNFITGLAASRGGGPFGPSPDDLAVASGVRYLGATGDGSTGGQQGRPVHLEVHYNQVPDNPQTWAQQMRFAVEGAI